MALPKILTGRGVNSCKVAVVTDNDSSYSIGDYYQLPAIQEFNAEMEYDTDQLFGDEEVKDTYANPISIKGSIKNGQIDLEAFGIITGQAYAASGTTPNQIARVDLGANVQSPFLWMNVQSLYQGGPDAGGSGSYDFRAWKIVFMNVKWGLASKKYLEFSADFMGHRPISLPSGESVLNMGFIQKNETAATYTN